MDANEARLIRQNSKVNGSWIDRMRVRGTISRIGKAARKNKKQLVVDPFLWMGFGDPNYVFDRLEDLGFNVTFNAAGWAYVRWEE